MNIAARAKGVFFKKMYLETFFAEIMILATFIIKTSDTTEIKSYLKMEILNSGFHRLVFIDIFEIVQFVLIEDIFLKTVLYYSPAKSF